MQRTNNERILLVDDSLHRCKLIARVLAGSGYVVHAAHTGEEGLVLVGREPTPDLVLMDVLLPGISGIEACRRICEPAQRKSPPVLLLSARATRTTEQAEGLEAGAVGYIAWPISARELNARVSAALGTNRQPREETTELSPRQLEVVAWLAAGLTTKEIAGKLGVTVRTAETHRAAILRRLGMHSSTHLVRYAIERGITPESLGLL